MFKDENGNEINVPVYVNEYARVNRVYIDANKISTALEEKILGAILEDR